MLSGHRLANALGLGCVAIEGEETWPVKEPSDSGTSSSARSFMALVDDSEDSTRSHKQHGHL